MPSAHRLLRRIPRQLEWRVDADIDFEVGDLMFYATSTQAHATVEYVYPMADFIWDTSEEVTRRNAVPYFIGVAMERRTGREFHDTTCMVASGCHFLMPMTSGTPLVGTLLGFEKASGNTLLSAKLQIVTDPADAIGYCVKRYTAATTTVECILFSPFDIEGGLASRVHTMTFNVPGALHIGASNLLLNLTFKKRVKLLSLASIETAAATLSTIYTIKNGANSLDDTHTVTATGVGTYLRTEIVDANAYDLFYHDDPMDILSGGQATAGECTLILEYMDMPVLET